MNNEHYSAAALHALIRRDGLKWQRRMDAATRWIGIGSGAACITWMLARITGVL